MLDSWIGIAGLVGTLVFGVLSIILYFRSVRTPKPMYRIDRSTIRYLDPSRDYIPGFIRDGGGPPEAATHFVSFTIYFWNGGRGPIRGNDILVPYTIRLDHRCLCILDAEFINKSRDVCEFELEVDQRNGNVEIHFDVMEPGDGAAIRVIYAGGPRFTLHMTGEAVGVRMIRSG